MDFRLYLELTYSFRPTVQQATSLLELLQARVTESCTQEEFEALAAEFKSASNTKLIEPLTFPQFQQLLQHTTPMQQMLTILEAFSLTGIDQQVIDLQNQYLDLFSCPFVTQDEIVLILYSLMRPDELRSGRNLFLAATQTLSELNCVRGLVPRSAMIRFMLGFGVDEGSAKQNIEEMGSVLAELRTFSQLLDQYVSDQTTRKWLRNSPLVHSLRYGSQPSQQLVNQISTTAVKQLQLEGEAKNNICGELTKAIIEFEHQFQRQIGKPKLHKKQPKRVEITEDMAENPGFDIDSLILSADWVDVDDKNAAVGKNDKAAKEELSFEGQMQSPSFVLSQKVNVTQKDDDAVRKLRKLMK